LAALSQASSDFSAAAAARCAASLASVVSDFSECSVSL
jgi:hypothetical protein